ncbi:MAG: WYL domain-containing protein [Bacilli bacterium]|nr:WYL domain-containing protein [Bacilli bacterium]MDD3305090.1 WYL domain-containing protein [Bacilli bacterium]MDD4053454.1 WYL domain-containing protein [Bacilli bacterium]MDD4410899.1 WYL domain-containing protein [Bacilli bacterium]
MSKISNVFTMLELLSNGKKYSIKELSDLLEVTPRMVRLYKDELEHAGIYIDTIRGQYGGYILNRDTYLPKVGFSKYDIDLLKNVYNLIKDNNEFKLQKEFIRLEDKITGIYHGSKKKNSSVNLEDKKDEKTKYNMICKAIKNKNKMLINFLSADGNSKDRVIHPCDVFFYNDSWYVSAFCELRAEIRHFRLERILEYKLLEEKYI